MARPRSKYPPVSAADRQRECRARKRGEMGYCAVSHPPLPPEVPIPRDPNEHERLLEHYYPGWRLASPNAIASAAQQTPALPAPGAPAGTQNPALPAPASSAGNPMRALPVANSLQRALPGPQAVVLGKPAARPDHAAARSDNALALRENDAIALHTDDALDFPATRETLRLSLPPAVADRLRSLLARHDAGKLTAAERAEAKGLLDIAEYFAIQRLRRKLAA